MARQQTHPGDGELTLNWLIAEDEADIRNLVSMMCTVWGHQVMAFESGGKVWDWLDKVDSGEYQGVLPEFALMDIRMPGKYGSDVAKRIRKTSRLQHIPIVLMTAYALSASEYADLTTNGADFIITKPLPDFEELRVLLHNIIHERSG